MYSFTSTLATVIEMSNIRALGSKILIRSKRDYAAQWRTIYVMNAGVL